MGEFGNLTGDNLMETYYQSGTYVLSPNPIIKNFLSDSKTAILEKRAALLHFPLMPRCSMSWLITNAYYTLHELYFLESGSIKNRGLFRIMILTKDPAEFNRWFSNHKIVSSGNQITPILKSCRITRGGTVMSLTEGKSRRLKKKESNLCIVEFAKHLPRQQSMPPQILFVDCDSFSLRGELGLLLQDLESPLLNKSFIRSIQLIIRTPLPAWKALILKWPNPIIRTYINDLMPPTEWPSKVSKINIGYNELIIHPESRLKIYPMVDRIDFEHLIIDTMRMCYASSFTSRMREPYVANCKNAWRRLVSSIISPNLISKYEKEYFFLITPIDTLIEELITNAQGEVETTLSIKLQFMYQLLNNGDCGKPKALHDVIQFALSESLKTLLVCRNLYEANAVKDVLIHLFQLNNEADLNEINIKILPIQMIDSIEEKYDLAIIGSQLQLGTVNWRMTANPFLNETIAMLYPFEIKRICHVTKDCIETFSSFAQKDIYSKDIIFELSRWAGNKPDIIQKMIPYHQLAIESEQLINSTLDRMTESSISSDIETIEGQSDIDIDDWVLVTFVDDEQLKFRANQSVDVLIDKGMVQCKAHSLQEGQAIILIDSEPSSSILDRIKATTINSDYKEALMLAGMWEHILRHHAKKHNDTAHTIGIKIREKGATITDSAISIWLDDDRIVLGPLTGENLKRIGEIYHDCYLIENWKKLDKAAKLVATVNRTMGRIISTKLKKVASSIIDSQDLTDSSQLLHEMGFTAGDLFDHIEVLHIAKIEHILAPLKKSEKLI